MIHQKSCDGIHMRIEVIGDPARIAERADFIRGFGNALLVGVAGPISEAARLALAVLPIVKPNTLRDSPEKPA